MNNRNVQWNNGRNVVSNSISISCLFRFHFRLNDYPRVNSIPNCRHCPHIHLNIDRRESSNLFRSTMFTSLSRFFFLLFLCFFYGFHSIKVFHSVYIFFFTKMPLVKIHNKRITNVCTFVK